MNLQTIIMQVDKNIARVTVNRPQAMNALNREVLTELRDAFRAIDADASLRGAIVTGAGEKAFIAGADIAAMREMSADGSREFCLLGHETMNAIENCRVPVIAAVNGFALGGGLELALSCDFIYAAKTAKLGLPETNLGLFPGFGGTQRLARIVGRTRAKELIYTAAVLSADEALALGLVNRVTEPGTAVESAEATLRKILAKGPLAVEAAKRAVTRGTDLPLAQGLAIEIEEFPRVFASEDARTGLTAFLEKKPPVFAGK